MATLTVWKFAEPNGAEHAVGVLEDLQKQELITIHDAAIVSWPLDRKRPKTKQLHNLAGAGALSGVVLGPAVRPVVLRAALRHGGRRRDGRPERIDGRRRYRRRLHRLGAQ